MIRWFYRQEFKIRRIFYVSLYLQAGEKIRPNSRVKVFGTFSRKPWSEKISCKFDPFFKVFKSEIIRIRAGQQFKFIIDEGV
jgi:hypothetical protein